jgi:hypothetical protein
MITQRVDDPDLNELQVSYAILGPDDVTSRFNYTLGSPYRTAGPILNSVKAGSYRVTMTVSDGKALAVTVFKTIVVLPLEITGAVSHTDKWFENLNSYNAWLNEQLRDNKMTLVKFNEL